MSKTGPENAPGSSFGQTPKVDMSDRAKLIADVYQDLGLYDKERAEATLKVNTVALDALVKVFPNALDTHMSALLTPDNSLDEFMRLLSTIPSKYQRKPAVITYVDPLTWSRREINEVNTGMPDRKDVALGMVPHVHNGRGESGLLLTRSSLKKQGPAAEQLMRDFEEEYEGAITAYHMSPLSYLIIDALRMAEGKLLLDNDDDNDRFTATRFPQLGLTDRFASKAYSHGEGSSSQTQGIILSPSGVGKSKLEGVRATVSLNPDASEN